MSRQQKHSRLPCFLHLGISESMFLFKLSGTLFPVPLVYLIVCVRSIFLLIFFLYQNPRPTSTSPDFPPFRSLFFLFFASSPSHSLRSPLSQHSLVERAHFPFSQFLLANSLFFIRVSDDYSCLFAKNQYLQHISTEKPEKHGFSATQTR